MQLKQLRLLGFKTFADKTEIEIDQGMTAIVGPNGSGKSNIVDALLWVLGEQNPRLLRGATSQDVIFSGSDRRKPLGMAEVRLTIDNSDARLLIDFAEVVITRRVYRSGESQYLLNNAACRLKDIVELFLDTGMGKGAYSFVSQNEIDAVLSARAEDRRELFEEAAGIKKYRAKKRDALRKLEAADANLTRVHDILGELESQRESMERQAVEARRYLMLQDRLHEIEVGMLVAELQKADYEIYAAKQEQDQDRAALLALNATIVELEIGAAGIDVLLASLEVELDAARAAAHEAHAELMRVEGVIALSSERAAAAARSFDLLSADIGEIEIRLGSLADSIEFDRDERQRVDMAETSARERWAGSHAALTELEAAVQQASIVAAERSAERTRILQIHAGQEAALSSAIDRLAELAARRTGAENQEISLVGAVETAQARDSADQAEREAAQRRLDELAVLTSVSEAQVESCRAALDELRSTLDGARRRQAADTARLSTIVELQENHEGFYQGVKAVLGARRRGEITGSYSAVVDILSVPEQYRVAIEVALGGSLQDIVTSTEAEAKAAIEWLKRNRAGRATFLPLPLIRPAPRTEIRGGAAYGVQNAANIVSADKLYESIVELLLGRVLVVDQMDDAIAASRRLNGWSRIVTTEGELLTPGGALSGGSLQGKGAHLIGRKGEMDDLRASLPAAAAEVTRLTAEVEAAAAALSAADEARNATAGERASIQAQAAAMETARAVSDRELTRLLHELEECRRQLGWLTQQSEALKVDADRLRDALEAGSRDHNLAKSALSMLNDEAGQLVRTRDAKRTETVGLEVEVGRFNEKREGLTRSIASDRAALAALEQQLEQKVRQRTVSAVENAEAGSQRHAYGSRLEEMTDRHAELQQLSEACRVRRQARLDESAVFIAEIREAVQSRELVTRSLHDAELRLARLEVLASQAVERLEQEYGITRVEALARPEEVGIDRNTAMEVGRIRREIRAMGSVNTGAVEEFDRLTERHTFLSVQRADLDAGRQSLLQTIKEIDESTRGVFMETFEAVREEFQRLFCRLFEGGSTKLVLTDPNDLLETGIDVIAQPPGKKPQHLSLLSGGERALTATALLFAFLAVRPSPFVILDEVDAPLDGANIEKFTALVRDFSERSQFLLITHNPVTMEAAPTWYGVSMREPGVSAILSYRVPQESIVSEREEAVVVGRE